jgi:hypothetical protein
MHCDPDLEQLLHGWDLLHRIFFWLQRWQLRAVETTSIPFDEISWNDRG